jgi:cell division protein ZapB
MSRTEELIDRVERLLLRHDELQRTNVILQQQLQAAVNERDSLRARLAAARSRIDTLIDKLPAPILPSAGEGGADFAGPDAQGDLS